MGPTSRAIAYPTGPRFDPAVRSHGDKITFGEMRESGVRGLLIYCGDYKCVHSITLSADRWPDQVRLSDLESRFICQACGKRGADVRPDFAMQGTVVRTAELKPVPGICLPDGISSGPRPHW